MKIAIDEQLERFTKTKRKDNPEASIDDTEFQTFLVKENVVTASKVRLIVREGKHRMVRRMLHNAGHSVLLLHRVRYGCFVLDGLKERSIRLLQGSEDNWTRNLMSKFRKSMRSSKE
jgi:16S rRNA U516 pseudouridylate synthase RsuA-like enzyme